MSVIVALPSSLAHWGQAMTFAATVLSTHLTELLKSNTAELLSYAEVHKLIKELPKEQAAPMPGGGGGGMGGMGGMGF